MIDHHGKILIKMISVTFVHILFALKLVSKLVHLLIGYRCHGNNFRSECGHGAVSHRLMNKDRSYGNQQLDSAINHHCSVW